MSFLNTPAWQSLMTDVLLPLLLAFFTTTGAAFFQHFKSRLPAGVYTYVTQLAQDAVNKAEQMSTRTTNPISPDQRKQLAVDDITAILAVHHLAVPAPLIDLAIESAVYTLGKTGMMGGNAPIPAALQPVAAPLPLPLPTATQTTQPVVGPPPPPPPAFSDPAPLTPPDIVTVAPGVTTNLGGSTTTNAAATPAPDVPTDAPSAT